MAQTALPEPEPAVPSPPGTGSSTAAPPSLPVRTLEPSASAPVPLAARIATGRDAFSRLAAYLRHGRLERLEAHVAPLSGAEAQKNDTDLVVRALNQRWGFRLRPLARGIARAPGPLDPPALMTIAAAARRWLAQSGGDLFVWGEVPSPGTTIHLRFVPATAPLDEQVGGSGLLNVLGLPIGFPPAFADLVHTVALAAAVPATAGQARGRFYRLATGFRAAARVVASLPPTLTSFERGSLHAGLGDAAALLAQHPPYRPLAVTAIQAYRTALRSLHETEAAGLITAIHRNLGGAALLRPEADYDARVLGEAVEALRTAAGSLDRIAMSQAWAATQDRLGEALYRLEPRSEEPGLLDEAVAAHRAALTVFDRSVTPLAWRRAKHNLGRAAQVLGEQRRSRELLETAVAACRDALTAAADGEAPLARAAIHNTLGAALFLLGRHGGGEGALADAIAAFAESAALAASQGATEAEKLAIKNKARVESARRRAAVRTTSRPAR